MVKGPVSNEVLKSMSDFYQRSLVSIPIIKNYPHQSVTQRCGLRAATIELDTTAHPNIEYVAGSRMSIYPVNPDSNVQFLIDFINDDLTTIFLNRHQSNPGHQSNPQSNHNANPNNAAPNTHHHVDQNYNSPFWVKFIEQFGKQHSLRMALTYFLDLTGYPSRDLLRYVGECCAQKPHRTKMEAIVASEESWEKYICQDRRTLRSVFEEFTSCKKRVSAKRLIINELIPPQQPRQYSISNIKSAKRFRAEIIVFEHKFSNRQMALNLKTIKEQEIDLANASLLPNQVKPTSPRRPGSPMAKRSPTAAARSAIGLSALRSVGAKDSNKTKGSSDSGRRSLRSVAVLSASPISQQQIQQLQAYSGPLMSLYAASNISATQQVSQIQRSTVGKSVGSAQATPAASNAASSSVMRHSLFTLPDLVSGVQSELTDVASGQDVRSKLVKYEGFCSNYLLGLQTGDQVICEFVENPRFTLKGNRERPIMMIGQDVGLIAFRAFWQQRSLEYDRAQIFYTLFKDLSPKKFGDMQLVCLTGNRCKIEEFFKREINSALTHKVISSATYINRQQLIKLIDPATITGRNNGPHPRGSNSNSQNIQIHSKELLDLGTRIYQLLVENNGCLYTCCDPYMTQAIEILLAECITRCNKQRWTREQVMLLLPRWKGTTENPEDPSSPTYQLENTFERAQIVQEIYDSSI